MLAAVPARGDRDVHRGLGRLSGTPATGKVVREPLVSQTTWAKQADGSWKSVNDINAVYPGAGP